ncbi:GntR family transcriptional regulator [Nitrincola alkalilacustris]|uniref:GntR family transcriptional regulator n=1 Tax=Nitrincola alkalilacustris TaxID=1571224 RepID=UPI00124E5938|nr:GntR family transcriptional regulator [Nitrincola alkalilacustris]
MKEKASLQGSLSRKEKESVSSTQDDRVYAHIFEAILEQRLAPGVRLSEETLGEIFDVSRTTIRRALTRLSHEQVVLLRPNRGAVVASPSLDEAQQIFFARRMVEKAITELAVENATSADIASLRAMVAEEQACFARHDVGAGIRLSGEFHLRLADIAGNAPLGVFQRSLVSQSSLVIALYDVGSKSHCSFDEHKEIIDAIERKDAVRAVDLMMHHMDHIDAKLNLSTKNTSDNLHEVFSHLAASGKKTSRKRA